MTRSENYAEELANEISGSGLSREECADLISVPIETLRSWLKPSYKPGAPEWAVIMLRYKLGKLVEQPKRSPPG